MHLDPGGGGEYYHCTTTGTTTFDRPPGFVMGWVCQRHPSDPEQPLYHNNLTGISQWERPDTELIWGEDIEDRAKTNHEQRREQIETLREREAR